MEIELIQDGKVVDYNKYQRKTSFPVRWNTSRSTASTRLNMKVRQRKCRNLSNAVIR